MGAGQDHRRRPGAAARPRLQRLTGLDGPLAGLDGLLAGLDGPQAGLDGLLTGLDGLLAGVAAGRPPAADGAVTVLPRAAGGAVAAVLGFTAHHVVAADVSPAWVRSVLPVGSLSAPLSARFLTALADRVGASPGSYDAVLLAPAQGRPSPAAGEPAAGLPASAAGESVLAAGLSASAAGESVALARVESSHSRVARALRYRVDVRAYAVEGGLLVLGRGLAGRWEVAIEVEPAYQGRGLGRRLAAAAPALLPPGTALWAQVAPANVASLRAFLAAGFRPVGAEVLFA